MIMTIVGYCRVFITKCKYTFEYTVHCILSEVEKFCGFLVNRLATTNFSSITILPAITHLSEIGYGHNATMNVLSKL